MQVARTVTRLGVNVSTIATTYALVLLRLFWYIPLAVFGALSGPKFRNFVAGIVSPKSKKGNANGDDENEDND